MNKCVAIGDAELYQGDCLEVLTTLPDESVQCCVTSPPYWGLRDYGCDGQIGLEPTPEAYVARMVDVFREVRRVLRADGTCWVNLGDSYTSTAQGTVNAPQPKGSRQHADQWANRRPVTGLKPKDLVGIPWRVAFALQADGWWLRQDIIWAKKNPMPESVKDRCTKAHEYLFLLSKSERYFFDSDAMRELSTGGDNGDRAKQRHKHVESVTARVASGDHRERTKLGLAKIAHAETRNRRSVWTVATRPYKGAHFATFPPALIEPCILAGCPDGGVVLDPFNGSGTTGAVALQHGRRYIGIDLNPEYINLAVDRIGAAIPKQMVMGF